MNVTNYLRTYVPVPEVYNSSDCFNKLPRGKEKRKEKHEKMSSQLKLDMTSGIITADHPFITLCCQEDVGFLTSGPSRIAMVLLVPELGNQHLHESPEVNNK
jgi:hypothetical protein